jgi:signal transduction protein with GAF and PtsI domain
MPVNLKDQLKQKDQEIALLHEIARIVNSTVALEDLLKKLCDMIVRQMDADACLIYLFEENKDELVLRGSHQPHPQQLGRVKLKVGEGVTGWVAEKRKPVAIAKQASEDPRFKPFGKLQEDQYEAFLSVPVTLKNELIGVLNVHHKKAHAHSPAEVQLAEHISEEIAGAIDHARIIQEAQQKSRAIQTLAKMSQTITQGAYLQEILQLIVTMTAEMMGSKICSLMLLDEKGKELRIAATQSLSEEYRSKPPLQMKGSVSGRALTEKRAIIVSDVTADPQYAYPDIAKKENLRSVLVVPMLLKEKAVGVLNCYTSDVHDFSSEEIDLVQAVANQAAVAIEHTRAMEQAVAAQEALETRKLVERAKGILMRQQGFTEDAAFRLIQRQAMDRRTSMKEVAEALILSEEIKTKK